MKLSRNTVVVPTIDNDVPLPEGRGAKGPRSPISKTLVKMKVGDSFAVPSDLRSNVCSSASVHGVKVATRTIDEDTVRVWRTA
jgi:hypothetical protein